MSESDRELTRDEFRQAVFERDNYDCVVCGRAAVDAHHLYERKQLDKNLLMGYSE